MALPRKELTHEREREAWQLRLQGWTQENIAARLGVSQPAICVALKRIEKRLAEEFKAHAEEEKGKQSAALWEIYRQAMAQWERSCQDAERVTVVTGRAKASDTLGMIELPDLETTVREGQSGNPALLAQAMKALADIRAIWGLDAPTKQEHSGPGGGPIPIIREVVVELPPGTDE